MTEEVDHDFSPFFRIFKDGRIERLSGNETIPPSLDPKTGVESKDIVISSEKTSLSARLFIPKITNPIHQKLPLLIYFHGGAFCIQTPFSPTYHNYLNLLVSQANIVAVSVNFRRATEHLLPVAFEDSWAAIQWAASHSNQKGPEEWLNEYVNFEKVFFAGDTSGATIAHNMAMRAGAEELGGGNFNFKLVGLVLMHPFFWGKEAMGAELVDVGRKVAIDKFWVFVCPSSSGLDDPIINPGADLNLWRLGCSRVLVCVAEKDFFRGRGVYYYEVLGESGWGGEREIMEAEGEDHVFHLLNPSCEKAVAMLKRLVSFINEAN